MRENETAHSYADTWIEQGILYLVYKQGLIIDLQVAKTIVAERLEWQQGVTYPMVIDARAIDSVDDDAREYFTTEEATRFVSAGAIYLESTVRNIFTLIAGNIFLKVDEPPIPTRLFTQKEEALSWLEPYKALN